MLLCVALLSFEMQFLTSVFLDVHMQVCASNVAKLFCIVLQVCMVSLSRAFTPSLFVLRFFFFKFREVNRFVQGQVC